MTGSLLPRAAPRQDVAYLCELRRRTTRALAARTWCGTAGVEGALISHALFAHWRSYVALGLEAEARLVIGGGRS